MDKIFGYAWEDIQRAQQGGRLSRPVTDGPDRLAADLALLKEHGAAELVRMQYHGTIDRLTRAGLWPATPGEPNNGT